MSLDGDELRKAFFFRQRVRLGDLPCKAVGNTDVSGFSRLHDAVQAIHDVVNWCLPVPHVIDVEIHIVHPKVPQTGIDHVLDVLLTADALFDLLLCPRKELGGNDHILTPREIPQRSANILLTGAALISDGRIIKINAEIQASLNDFSGMFLVDGPAVLAASGITESHTSHADPGYI